MSKPFAHGLVVGKFAPLHLGHELVIQRALDDCEQVSIISYSNPELPGCAPERRAAWLAVHFPQAQSLVVTKQLLHTHLPGVPLPQNGDPDHVHREFTALLCHTFFKTTVGAVFTSEAYGDGFAADLTRRFRALHPTAPEVRHVLVDQARQQIPISGTALRGNIHANRRWLSPEAYSTFVERVAILGGESSGKSTLAKALAQHFGTVHTEEYGRELWEATQGALRHHDMLSIARTQVAREDAATLSSPNRYVFCDTSPLTTLFYSETLFSRAENELYLLAARPYAVTILCAPDFPFVQDGTRQDAAFRARQHDWYRGHLASSGRAWFLAEGPLAQRVKGAAAYLQTGLLRAAQSPSNTPSTLGDCDQPRKES